MASASSTPSRTGRCTGGDGGRAVLGDELHGLAAVDQVHARAGRERHGPLQARAGPVSAVGSGAPVEQHGHPAPPRPLLEPHHQLVVAGRAAPVHAPQLVAAAVGPHEDVRATLAGARRARAVRPVARPQRVRHPAQRHRPGQHQQPVRTRHGASELGQTQRIGAVRDERVRSGARRAAPGAGGSCTAAAVPRARDDTTNRGGAAGPAASGAVSTSSQRADRRPAGDLQRHRRLGTDGQPVRRQRPLHPHRPPGGQGEQQREQRQHRGESADP